ncbi:MAG: lipoate--protein ligase family protein [Victivallales bacterium]|nr:lipoate--protein ligase family protein [Victivallales bacterium]
MTASRGHWYLFRDASHSPFYNMAMDELLLKNSAAIGLPLIRFYGWDRPSVSIGYVQNYNAVPHDRYTVVRRPTGGGVVYHDHDLTYTASIPADNPLCKLNRIDSYHVFHEAVRQVLAGFGLAAELTPHECAPVDRATMQCFTTPTRYDVVAGKKKCAGAAQRRTKNGILHQGSINLEGLNCDCALLLEKLLPAFEKQFDMNFVAFEPDVGLIARAEELAAAKYATDSWNKNKKFDRKNG